MMRLNPNARSTRLATLAAPFALAITLTLSAAFGETTGAHEEAAESDPPGGSVVNTPPERVSVSFDGEIAADGSDLRVLGPDGDQVDTGDGGLDLTNPDRDTLVASLPPDLAPGEYTVEWTSVAVSDGDSSEGSFTFTIDPSAAPVAAASPTRPALVAPTGTIEPADAPDSDDGGLGRGPIIVGLIAIAVAVAVVASVGRRTWWR